MLNTVRSSMIRIRSRTLFSSLRGCPFLTRRNTSGLSFEQATEEATGEKDMDQQEKLTSNQHTTTYEFSHSFGEGYATRCDEEGFGGIYGRDDANHSTEEKTPSKIIHESHPEFDKTQGCEVAEREKARHQKAVDWSTKS